MNIILAPHIDDAVFSCWHALKAGEAQVYNIFAGIPSNGTATLWDRLCGVADSRQMMQRRRRENDHIFKDLDVTSRYLDFLDNQYRHDSLKPQAIAETVLKLSPENASFLAPLAGSIIMRHRDHILVREAALLLIAQGYKVAFYPDIPYMYLPPDSQSARLDALNKRMSELLGMHLQLKIHPFDSQQIRSKAHAMKAYNSQWSMTNLTSLGCLKIMSKRNYEITLVPA